MVPPESASTVRVLYALPDAQHVVELEYEPGMTAEAAVARSGLAARYPAIAEDELVLGIWGVEVDSACPLKAGDRVEISRPLVADPRDMRRELLTDGRVMGGASAPPPKLRTKDRA